MEGIDQAISGANWTYTAWEISITISTSVTGTKRKVWVKVHRISPPNIFSLGFCNQS